MNSMIAHLIAAIAFAGPATTTIAETPSFTAGQSAKVQKADGKNQAIKGPRDAKAAPRFNGQRPNGERVKEMQERFAKELNLTDAQRARLEALRKSHMQKMQSLRQKAEGGASRESLRAEVAQLRKERHEAMNAILTADQKAKLMEMRKNAAERFKNGRDGVRNGAGKVGAGQKRIKKGGN
jgi:Spy/CpxP family protein refolding chaperone